MALYTSDSRERVRDAVDFVELVSARTQLRRAGAARYEGLCPFHDERTPSFGIDPVQKVYHCFGCGASGDVFTFVQETEAMDFKGALELLADRYGVELEREQEDPREAQTRMRRERLLELLDRTTAYYERYLWESREARRAREYLEGRGLGEEILREFRVGYAPSAWDRVLTASRRGGFSEHELYATGLVQRSRQSGQPYDRFRARITFPLCDLRGRVLGFGARSLSDEGAQGEAGSRGALGASAPGGARGAASGPPKYLNTSDNEIYHKGRHLYGANLARAQAARAGEVVVCEGYTDTIALQQAGMRNAVGLMGTALTPEQVGELARMSNRVLLALDSDSAGQEAMLRASAVAAQRKLELRVVEMPPGADPAELLQREGADAMRALADRSVPFVRFRVQRALASGDRASAEGRDHILAELVPVLATLSPGAMRMELTRLVAEQLSLPESIVERALGDGARASGGQATRTREDRLDGHPGGASAGPGPGPPPGGRRSAKPAGASFAARGTGTERAFLALCLASPGAGAQALAEVDPADYFSDDLLRRAAEHLREHLSDPARGVPAEDPQLGALIAELVVEAGRESERPDMLEVQRLQLELASMDRRIHGIGGGQRGQVSELARRRGEVQREFDLAYARVLEETGEREA